MEPRTLGGVLAGGFSRRMGRPKHLIEVDGRSLLAIAVAALKPHCEEVVLLGTVKQWPADVEPLRCVPDLADIRGPLAGIGAALADSPDRRWFIMACDMPRVTPAQVKWLLSVHDAQPETTAAMPWIDDRPLPTFAVYAPAIIPALEELIEARRGPIGLGHRSDVLTPTPPEAGPFVNVNTPEELDLL